MAMSSTFSSGNAFHSAATFDDDEEFGAFAAAAPASSPQAPMSSSSSASAFAPLSAPFAPVALPEISFADDEYDNPFADIVHEAPKSANASRASSFSATGNNSSSSAFATATGMSSSAAVLASATTDASAPALQSHAQTSAVSLAFGSPLLSFSPVASRSAAAPSSSSLIPDIFASDSSTSAGVSSGGASSAPVAEAELLSFSPLLLSSSAPASGAPSSLSSFLLDSPVALSASSPPTASRFALPPPRAASSPALSPARSSSSRDTGAAATKSASFAAHVSVGELLSFSPVASASATSFSDSFASSSGAAAMPFFGNDDLFSLSTPDLSLELGATSSRERDNSVSGAADLVAPTAGLTLGDLTSVSTVLPSPVASADAPSAVTLSASTTTYNASVATTSLFEPLTAGGGSDLLGDATSTLDEHRSDVFEAAAHEDVAIEWTSHHNSDHNDDAVADASSPIATGDANADATEAPTTLFDALQSSPAGHSQIAFASHESSPVASTSDELRRSFAAPSLAAATQLQPPMASDRTAVPAPRDVEHTPLTDRRDGESIDDASFLSMSNSSSPKPSSTTAIAVADATDAAPIQSDVAASLAFGQDDEPSDAFSDFAAPSQDADAARADAFGAFEAAPSFASADATAAIDANGDDDAFGDFGQSSSALSGGNDDDDDFGDFGGFGQSTSGGDDDFGDFGQSAGGAAAGGADDDFGDFAAPEPSSFGAAAQHTSRADSDDDDGFGDFSAPPATIAASPAASASALATPFHASSVTAPSARDLETFFRQAFPALSAAPAPLEPAPQVATASLHTQHTRELFQDTKHGRSEALVTAIYRAAVEQYVQGATPSSPSTDPSGAGVSAADSAAQYVAELKARRLKHLKYVLTEKIQDAARHDGLFPHGSAQHHALLSLVNSDDERKMRDALTRVQDALFTTSVNDAMMRMARQAALSAKAKIAEQAAHQQASSRGSLLATTRQLLSRSGGTAAATSLPAASGSSSQDASESASGAAAHSSSGNTSGGDDSGGETSSNDSSGGRRRLSGSNESDVSGHPRASSSGGLMRKFQDRFSSFSSSRGRPRFVSLRRMGQSGDDVRKMELNLDAISGGLDEVKWKCAVFLYDVDEVAQVAPSQISLRAYPSKEVLTGKTDRAALLKLVKPGAIWTVDIGASNNDVLNAW